MPKTNIELSKKEGSLAHCLLANNDAINKKYAGASLVEFKKYVNDLVVAINDKPLDKKSPDTKRFLMSLGKQRSKDGILMLVWNTIQAGDGNAVLK